MFNKFKLNLTSASLETMAIFAFYSTENATGKFDDYQFLQMSMKFNWVIRKNDGEFCIFTVRANVDLVFPF